MALGPWCDDATMPARARTPRIGVCQSFIAAGIQVRIRLVEDDKERIAVERSGQARSVRLSADSVSPRWPTCVSYLPATR